MGNIKKQKPVWYAQTKTSKIFMPEKKAHEYTFQTGLPVFKKMKKYELDRL